MRTLTTITALLFSASAIAGEVVAIGTFAADAEGGVTIVESDVGAMMLAVVEVADREPWQVYVAAGGLQAPDSTRVWVRRGGEGQGAHDLAGGALYQRITERPCLLFSGIGPRSAIPLQLRVTGLRERYPGVVLSALDYTLVTGDAVALPQPEVQTPLLTASPPVDDDL